MATGLSFMALPREIRLQILDLACALPPITDISALSMKKVLNSRDHTLAQTTFSSLFALASEPNQAMLAYEMAYIADNRKKQAKIGRQYCRDKHKEARDSRAMTLMIERWKELDMHSKMWHHAENYFGMQISLARLEFMKLSALEKERKIGERD